VLDEAHNIRNSMTKTFKAVLEIKSKNRWCLTGVGCTSFYGKIIPAIFAANLILADAATE
jgi:hypothetical protein